MKKHLLLLCAGTVAFSSMSFTGVNSTEAAEEGEEAFACCSAYLTYEGETFEAIRVCQGGDSQADQIGACLQAEAYLDALLEAMQ